MAQIKVEITGTRATLKDLDNEYKDYLRRTAVALKEELQKHTPIDKGGARRGWKEKINDDSVEVSNNVPYIERLENNYSPQTKGKGIIKPAVSSFNRRKI